MPSLRRALFALLWYALLFVVSVNGIYALSSGETLSAGKLFNLKGFQERARVIVQRVVGRIDTKSGGAMNKFDAQASSSEGTANDQPERISRWSIPSMKEKPRQYDHLFRWAAETYGVEKRLIVAVMWAESSGNPWARSHEGALGLMQLMPSTAQGYVAVRNVKELYLPRTNVSIGARHLAWLRARIHDHFPKAENQQKRRVQLIAAAYNAGLEAVLRYRGIPPYRETQVYIRRVWRWYRRLSPSSST